jgi:hypothetical protein
MATYAIIENGKVANTIEAEQDFIDEQGLNAILVTEATGVPYDQAEWNGSVFIAPPRPAPVADLENRIPAPN